MMSVGTLTPLAGPPPYPIWKLSVQDYHRMIDVGVLAEDDQVELLEGWLVPKMPHNPTHDGTIELLDEVLRKRLPAGWRIRIQSAVTTDDSEPEPELAIVRGTARSFLQQHPTRSEIGLLIEVSDSTLSQDRTDKARLYARAGIVEYWVVNLRDRQLEVFTRPSGPTDSPSYGKTVVLRSDSNVDLRLDDQDVAQIPVSDLLP